MMSTASGRRSIATRNPSASHSTSAPAVTSLSSGSSRCCGLALRMVTSPRVIAAATAQVPATIRSGTVRCEVGGQRAGGHALDLDRRGAGAGDLGAHLDQHVGQVDDLRLAGRVVDHRGAVGQHGGHQDVLGGPDTREVQPHRRPGQPVRRAGDDVAVLGLARSRRAWPARRCACPGRGSRWRPRPAARPWPGPGGRPAGRARRSTRAGGAPARRAPRGRARPGRR